MCVTLSKRKAQRVQRAAPAPPPPASDRWLAYGTLPLRLFLGVTFLYGGMQKISDPGFLNPGSSTYIGAQLQAAVAQSPIGFLLQAFALATPQLTGIVIIAIELVVGALVVTGIATRWAAAAGAVLNFLFFLSISWAVQPYFLGSDSIYTVAWITLALVGDQGILTAGPVLFGASAARPDKPTDLDRRRLLIQLGGAAVGVVWVLSVVPRFKLGPFAGQPTSTTPSPASSPPPGVTGTAVGSVRDLEARGFLNFSDPKSGDPAVAVVTSSGVYAFDAICTHAGCKVNYDSGRHLFVCPCHGATFDANEGAAVVQGPALTPLTPIRIQEGSDGILYAG